jgi:hypothetical protein
MQNTLNNAKPVLRSRTVWGAGVAALAGLAGLFGHVISPADQAQAVDLIGQAVGVADRIVVIAGSALAIWGRITATRRLV